MNKRTTTAINTLRRHQSLLQQCESDGGGVGPRKGPREILFLLARWSQSFFFLPLCLAARPVLNVSLNNVPFQTMVVRSEANRLCCLCGRACMHRRHAILQGPPASCLWLARFA